MGTYEIIDPRFGALVNGNARLEQLYTGCRWAEGPAWFGAMRSVIWSDIPNNRMLRYDEAGGAVSVLRNPANNSNGNTVDRNFKFQAEYMHRTEDGSLAFNTTGASQSGSYNSSQSGWYMQGVYQFMPRWRVGLRYEELDSGSTDIGLVNSGALTAANFPRLAENDPKRSTAMIDFSPSEFSRFRLQFARDEARFNEADNQIFLQYIMSLGTHGAHKF